MRILFKTKNDLNGNSFKLLIDNELKQYEKGYFINTLSTVGAVVKIGKSKKYIYSIINDLKIMGYKEV